MRRLTRFAIFLGTIPDNIMPPPKIALISDGVDTTSETLRGKISQIQPGTDIISGAFGNIAARFITQTCPESRLYIAQAEKRKSESHNWREVLPSLAAEAIIWAIGCGVDIICIDWSIYGGGKETRKVIDLKKAIANAVAQGIPVFCPAGSPPSPDARSYPAAFDGCIRIGAATRHGEISSAAPAGRYDFVLPGEGIPLLDSGGLPSSYESGDHVATAIAAGLAGILVFCHRLRDSGKSNDPRRLTYIKHAFRGLGLDRGNFVLPDTLFEGFQAKGLDWKTHEEEMKGMFSDLIEIITMRGRV